MFTNHHKSQTLCTVTAFAALTLSGRVSISVSEFVPSSAPIDLSGTDSALYPFDPQEENLHEIWLPPTSMYPYFLFPGTASTRTAGNEVNFEFEGRHHRHQHRNYDVPELPGSPGRPKVILAETFDPYPDPSPEDDRASPEGSSGQHHRSKGNGEHQWRWSGQEGGSYERPRNTLGSDDGSSSSSSSFGSSSSNSVSSSSSSSASSSNSSLKPSSSNSFSKSFSSSSSSSVSLSKHDRASNTEHLQPHESEHGVLRHNDTGVHLHQEHRHRHHHDDYPALPQAPPPSAPPAPASPARPTPTVDETNPAPPAAPGTKKFAPRPTYEHGAVFDRPDDDLDDLDEFRNARLPVDRLFDLREAFDEFVGQGSYTELGLSASRDKVAFSYLLHSLGYSVWLLIIRQENLSSED